MTRSSSTSGYGASADILAAQYESVTFEEVHRATLHLYPTTPSRVLDLGAGTGRDAAALARLGHHVVAAEPVAELRNIGQRLHADVAITWVDDTLPGLGAIRCSGARFDLVLATAVWMHLKAGEREAAMQSVAGLLAPGAVVAMSLRRGPVPLGRRMFDVSAAETIALAARHRLHVVLECERADMLGRANVRWTSLVLRAST